jgi:hypothetical protein
MLSVPDHKQVVAQMIVYQIENWQQAAELLADEISRPRTDGVGEPRRAGIDRAARFDVC